MDQPKNREEQGAPPEPEEGCEQPSLPPLLRPRPTRPPTWRRVLYLILAAVFVVLGVVGWLVPLVTGIPFYLVAIAFLALASNRVRRWIDLAESRFPYRFRVKLRRGLGRRPFRRFHHVFNLPADGAGDADAHGERETTVPLSELERLERRAKETHRPSG